MAAPPHGYPEYNRKILHGDYTALQFAARVGDLTSARLLVAAGANVNDADAWGVSATVLAAHAGFREFVEFLLEKGADPNVAEAGFSALHVAIMRRDEKMAAALLARGADPNTPLQTWTPTRRASRDYNFSPQLVGASPFWLAARFSQPSVMRMLVEHGADPLVVHESHFVVGGRYEPTVETSTALMAATGMGSGRRSAWVETAPGEHEALTLQAVKLAVELGVDVNAANAEGQTALNGAKALKYDSVVEFLVSKGAKAGPDPEPSRDSPRRGRGSEPSRGSR